MRILTNKHLREKLEQADDLWNAASKTLSPSLSKYSDQIVETKSILPTPSELDKLVSKTGVYIATCVDLRDSTKHLTTSETGFSTPRDRLRRVYLETTALFVAAEVILKEEFTDLTEYLGDGVLAITESSDDSISNDVKQAYNRAKLLMEARTEVINPVLAIYDIPEIAFGIGISHSECFLTGVGQSPFRTVKVVGPALWNATKCADGRNQVRLHEHAHLVFPSSSGGKITFQRPRNARTSCYYEPKPRPAKRPPSR